MLKQSFSNSTIVAERVRRLPAKIYAWDDYSYLRFFVRIGIGNSSATAAYHHFRSRVGVIHGESKLREAIRAGDELVQAVKDRLAKAEEITSLGLEVLGLSILAIKPTPETARALEAESRDHFFVKPARRSNG
jgi:hypothetical protein